MVSKPEIIGQKLMNRVLSRNKDYGGILGEITGAQGTGKTSVLLSLTHRTIERNPDEKIFWREQTNAPIQIFKLGLDKINFMVPEDESIVFRDRDAKLAEVEVDPVTKFKLKEITYKIKNEDGKTKEATRIIPDYRDVYKKGQRGKANLVFFKSTYDWMEFLTSLREAGEWSNIFIDEMADICPSVNSGNLFKRIIKFSGTMGAVRRCMMNVFYNTQTAQDVDWKIRKKVMLMIFLPGAIKDKKSRVSQKAIDNLIRDPKNGNEAFLDMGGDFGKVRFTDIYKPVPGYHIEAHHIQDDEYE